MDCLPKKTYKKLDPEQSLKLIEQVKKYPCLWCKMTKDFKNMRKQAVAWNKIADELNISLADAKHCWKSLQASFRVYKAKVRNSVTTGSGKDHIYTPRWFAYQSMMFLCESADAVKTNDTVFGKMSNCCRFCMSQDCENLMLLSSAFEGLSFSILDVQQATGISISDSEITYLAVCAKCVIRIEIAVGFRRSCINENVKFMQLFGHIIYKLRLSNNAEANVKHEEYIEDDSLQKEMVLEKEPSDEQSLEAHDEPAFLPEPDSGSTLAGTASNRKKAQTKERIGDSEEDKPNNPNKRRKSNGHRKLLCGICGVLVYNLPDHTRSHTKENLHKCPHCPVQMAHSNNLWAHVRAVHEKVIVKSCEPCGKGFFTHLSYKSHLRTYHNIGAQYQCEICLKMFRHPSSRRAHIQRMHKGQEGKHECQICQKKFLDRGRLNRHETVHTGNTPYACIHCPKRFKSAFAKKTHELTHSGIDFACTLCTKVYRYKSLLSMHFRKCHPEECNGLLA
uniref:Putative alcohol dehydrogenase transcription factor myb/sant-like protein n=1 Tax=Anopheles darlingi TaxID=43151 RepID=A0A2M4CHH9_ANODA